MTLLTDVFGGNFEQDIDNLIINMNDLPVNNKSSQYLFAGILFNAAKYMIFNTETRVKLWGVRFVSNHTSRYASIIFEVREPTE
jgi:hypothetical protein